MLNFWSLFQHNLNKFLHDGMGGSSLPFPEVLEIFKRDVVSVPSERFFPADVDVVWKLLVVSTACVNGLF